MLRRDSLQRQARIDGTSSFGQPMILTTVHFLDKLDCESVQSELRLKHASHASMCAGGAPPLSIRAYRQEHVTSSALSDFACHLSGEPSLPLHLMQPPCSSHLPSSGIKLRRKKFPASDGIEAVTTLPMLAPCQNHGSSRVTRTLCVSAAAMLAHATCAGGAFCLIFKVGRW